MLTAKTNEIYIAELALVIPLSRTFFYFNDLGCKVGDLVEVNFNNREVYGICINTYHIDRLILKSRFSVEEKSLKPIKEIIFASLFSSLFVNFIIKAASYNMVPVGAFLELAIPNVFINIVKKEILTYKIDDEWLKKLDNINTRKKKERIKLICHNNEKRLFNKKDFIRLHDITSAYLSSLLKEGFVEAVRQKCNTIDALAAYYTAKKLADLPNDSKLGASVTNENHQIAENNDLGAPEVYNPFFIFNTNLYPLNAEQNEVFGSISPLLDGYHTVLLNGVTGSGKTEVYSYAIEQVINNDRTAQVLIMLPEIALTSQLVNEFENKFPGGHVVWHSGIAKSLKSEAIAGIIAGQIRIVIGARSAAWLPYRNLKLVVIDEEHDSSYKQDEVPIYHGRDMIIMRGSMENFPVILSSATPSLESYYNALHGKSVMFKLHNRAGVSQMPNIQLINLNENKLAVKSSISAVAREAIADTLRKSEQVMIFINRRGYARIMTCGACNYIFECPNCDNRLSYHKKVGLLKCHYCHFQISLPRECPECKSADDKFVNYLPGIEKIKEEVLTFLSPEAARIALFSSDYINSMEKAENYISDITGNRYNLIIGTQILSKGYNFPKLSLVVVLNIDVGSGEGDVRVYERLYQLLTQVSGRAGRSTIEGKVLIQTYNINNPVLKAIISGDQEKFYTEELLRRKNSFTPPYTRQVAIIISSESQGAAKVFAEEVAMALYKKFVKNANNKVRMLGPAESIVSYLKRQYRYRLLFQTANLSWLRANLKESFANIKVPQICHLKIDVDPYNFM